MRASQSLTVLVGLATCALGGVALHGCATATAIVVEVYSEVPCDRNAQVGIFMAGSLPELGAALPTAVSTRCDASGRMGSLVVLPEGAKDKPIALAVVTRNDALSPETCTPGARGCIVARRQLRFAPRTELRVRVDLRLSCLDVPCSEDTTCVRGTCVPATVACSGSCDEGMLLGDGGSDGGPPLVDGGEAGTDAGAPVVEELALGLKATCARKTGGRVYCWGDNSAGDVGDGTTTNRLVPTLVQNLGGVIALAPGCGITAVGLARCWGANGTGELGDGTTTNRLTPVAPVGVLVATQQITRASHTCFLLQGSELRCSGYNFYGGLGDGTTTQRTTPVASFSFAGIAAVGAGAGFTCALAQGMVRCWGANGMLQCGDTVGGPTRLSPNAIAVSQTPTAISVGSGHACALTMTKDVECWGSNFFSELGDGTTNDRAVPVKPSMPKTDIVQVSAGMDHTCALLSSGAVKCWGGAAEGQIGDGMLGLQRFTPVDVVGLAGPVRQIVAGPRRTCALLQDRRVQCWGSNVGGALGDGTTTNRVLPTFVVGL